MALDTANKRSSAIFVGIPFRGKYPFPDGTIDAGDRQHAAGYYRGVVAVVINILPWLIVIHKEILKLIIFKETSIIRTNRQGWLA